MATAAYGSILLPETRADPYPLYARLRESDPVFDDDLTEGWIVSRYHDVRSVLQDHRRFSSERSRSPVFAARTAFREDMRRVLEHEMIFKDPPYHTRMRRLLQAAFKRRRVMEMEAWIASVVDAIVARVARDGGCDLVEELCDPLPALTLARLIGIPEEDHGMLRRWTHHLVWLAVPLRLLPQAAIHRIEETGVEMGEYLRGLFRERQCKPRGDLLSLLVGARGEERVSEPELFAVIVDLLVGGHETAANLLSTASLALLEHPEQRRLLEQDAARIPGAVEEFLRFESPIQLQIRVATEDVEIRSAAIRAGDPVLVLLGSANRDAAVFDEPDRLDVLRPAHEHLAFGNGVHYCMGATLARLEIQLAIRGLVQRFPEFRVADYEFRWKATAASRGLESLSLWF